MSICVYLWLISLCLFASPTENKAQVKPVYDYGAIGLGQLLKRLNNTKSVMHIGAHPDDEDSGLLAFLARGENARTAYLSLTRGDGGQNIIGNELGESLGVIRTEELLQARRLDGAEQFFTRAYDYGFSKTLDEAKAKWDEKIILCDVVRAIRTFRPLVVISRFSGTPADGHGQHQYSGYIAPLAVKAAADVNQCKDSGTPWQILKFYVGQGFRSTAEPTLKINTGEYDFLLGRSYFEIAMEGRSQHKTQEQGVLELRGERFSGLNLIENNLPKTSGETQKETSVFDGIETSLAELETPENKSEISRAQSAAERALREYAPAEPQKITAFLIDGLIAMRDAQKNLLTLINEFPKSADAKLLRQLKQSRQDLERREREFAEVVKLANGITIDALADKEIIAPDESFQTVVKVFFPKSDNIKVKEIALQSRNGWTVSRIEPPKENAPNFRRETANEENYFSVKVPPDAEATQPYWLKNDKVGDLFTWQHDENQNLPFQPPLVSAAVKIAVGGTEITFNQAVQYRYADDVRGEIRRDLTVVPILSISLDQKLLIIPTSGKPQTRRVVMSITNLSEKPIEARANLGAGLIGGWKSTPATQTFNLKNKNEKTAIAFELTIPAGTKPGNYTVLPSVTYPEGVLSDEMHTLAYPHIQTHRFYTQVKAKVSILDLNVEPVKVGYVMGSGDEIPEAIRQMGLSVELLNELDLTSGDLSRFQTIVVGIRAFQVRQDLISNNQKLLDYVKNGGNLIVQYQRPDYETLLPFPAKLGARVADENAKITILDSPNPIFNFPNKITEKDFENWVQERNLYAFTTFDANYQPLLEAHDAGEPENKGGLVVANLGKGKYVYCSYAFFRQLPAGVPGAYRLFANLLSLPKVR
ncbi:MAG: PIG-L family deacetylase [Pyrinomonadaceae bacterium]|nr:PIG-L family deacetylase [Pyrinomonadaceae bacterium]